MIKYTHDDQVQVSMASSVKFRGVSVNEAEASFILCAYYAPFLAEY